MERATPGTIRSCTIRGPIALLLAWTVGAGLVSPGFSAADPQVEYEIEARLLDSDLDRYVEAREREIAAIRELRRLADELDEVLSSPTSSLAEMRSLEAAVAVARDAAYLRLQETENARTRMYDRMERLADMARGLRQQEQETADRSGNGPEGRWKFHLQGIDLYSLVDLALETSGIEGGWTIVGTYRNSNGHEGTMRGLFRSNRLELEAMDSRRGKVATFDGSVDANGQLSGTWVAVQSGLDSGRPAGGRWTAQRISPGTDSYE
jgi:hypothetical protein